MSGARVPKGFNCIEDYQAYVRAVLNEEPAHRVLSGTVQHYVPNNIVERTHTGRPLYRNLCGRIPALKSDAPFLDADQVTCARCIRFLPQVISARLTS